MSIEKESALMHQDRRSGAIAIAQPESSDPILSLMSKFSANQSLDSEKIKALLDIYVDGQRRMQEMQDERAFRDAMAAFHEEPGVVRVIKDKKNMQYKDALGNGAPYASLGKEASVIVPLLGKHHITMNWGKLKQTDKTITLSCTVSYGLFKGEPVEITLPIDSSGAKNGPQQIKSSITYARIITMECACGVAPIDSLDSLDDDANAMTGKEPDSCLDDGVAADLLSSVEGSGSKEELTKNYWAATDATHKCGKPVECKNADCGDFNTRQKLRDLAKKLESKFKAAKSA